MKQVGLIAFFTICIIGIVGYGYVSNQTESSMTDTSVTEVILTAGGFEPATVTIAQGETVRWRTDTDDFYWPASDQHPTHGIYPEFDPLAPVPPTETWEFTFEKVGEWAYHDHIKANMIGAVIVTE